jgi:BirA family biotin operon repressor/biotin-[acetyl-CoA-carboxylase] ligase
VTPPDHPRHRDDPQGWHVRHVAETGSTNADLLAEAATARDRTVLRADHQTAGRGRLDRRWDAPAGANLLVSILFRGPIEPAELVRRVGLAVVLAARDACGVDAALKWPNDVLVDGRKAAGVLAQQAPNGAVVVGAGVNLGWAPDGAARLGDVDPDGFLRTVLDAFDALPDDVSELYRASLATLGRRVRVERPTDAIVGTAIDVDAHGRLVVLDECAISHHIEAGDVIHLRPAP